jgi:hypothetical protein
VSENGAEKGRKTQKNQDQLETAGVLQPLEDGQSVEIKGSFDDLLPVNYELFNVQTCQSITLNLCQGHALMTSSNRDCIGKMGIVYDVILNPASAG